MMVFAWSWQSEGSSALSSKLCSIYCTFEEGSLRCQLRTHTRAPHGTMAGGVKNLRAVTVRRELRELYQVSLKGGSGMGFGDNDVLFTGFP